jgi:hypothetical protein
MLGASLRGAPHRATYLSVQCLSNVYPVTVVTTQPPYILGVMCVCVLLCLCLLAGIPSILVAAASFDDMVAITGRPPVSYLSDTTSSQSVSAGMLQP